MVAIVNITFMNFLPNWNTLADLLKTDHLIKKIDQFSHKSHVFLVSFLMFYKNTSKKIQLLNNGKAKGMMVGKAEKKFKGLLKELRGL